MTTLFLIRHGETDWNREGRWQGHADRPLTERGAEQARVAADVLRSWTFAAVYASDLRRARDSAAPLSEAVGLPVIELAALREIDTGSWTGLTHAEVSESDAPAAARHDAGTTGWSGGETYDALQERTAAALADLAGRHDEGDTVAVFTHGGVIRAAVALVFDAPAEAARTSLTPLAHLSLTIIEIAGGRRLVAFNRPLAPAEATIDI